MNVPLWVSELAAAFWRAAGGPEPLPRTLRGPLLRSRFDLTVQEMSGLGLRKVRHYLAEYGVPCPGSDRRLRACLAIWKEAAFIFLEADDEPAEQTFSLAHEVAHFLRDYWQPRQRACACLGEHIADVFDGLRSPTPAERVHAVLNGVPLGPYVHLMRRGRRHRVVHAEVAAAEVDADRLAYELLAPAAEVLGRLLAGGDAVGLLRRAFGLPADAAAAYAAILLPEPPPADPLLARLKKARAACRTPAGRGELLAVGPCDERRP